MNFRHISVALFILGALSQSSCSLVQQQDQQQEAPQEAEAEETNQRPPMYLGSVHQVYPERQFALLRIIGPMPAEGDVLISHPFDGTTDRIGNLCVASGQHSRNGIIAADIRSGVVMKGDRVFQYRNILQDEEAPEEGAAEETSDVLPIFQGLEQDIELPQESFTEETPDYGVSRFNAAKRAQEAAPAEQPAEQPAAEEPAPQAPAFPEKETTDDTVIDLVQPAPVPGRTLDDIPDTLDGWDNM